MRSKILIILIAVFLIFCPQKTFADSFQNGVSAYQAGNYSYAESYFRSALQQNPSNDVIKYYLAITLVQNRKINEAKSLYKDIISTSSSQNVVSLAQQGLKLLGDNSSGSYSKVTKAVLNVSTTGNVIVVNNVNLNDRTKAKFIFDTGASLTTISSDFANKLGISTANAPKIQIMTGSGYIDAPKIKIKKIEINGLCAYNVDALVADLPMHTSGMAGDVAGLLGLSFINNFKVTVDRAHNQVILEKN